MKLEKEATIKRLNRIEGQVRGIAKMIDEERYCMDILQQMQAIKSDCLILYKSRHMEHLLL